MCECVLLLGVYREGEPLASAVAACCGLFVAGCGLVCSRASCGRVVPAIAPHASKDWYASAEEGLRGCVLQLCLAQLAGTTQHHVCAHTIEQPASPMAWCGWCGCMCVG